MSEPPPPAAHKTSTTPLNIATATPPYPSNISYKTHIIHGGIRDYRKGNWTPEETLILITAKRLDDERRINNAATTTTSSSSSSSRAGGELRWKWVENYCWSNGCLRSQNQCNDKWDNLLRDYKKVRDYQLRSRDQPSYWAMDKTQRKHLNLPSNLLPNIYEALNDVVQKKHLSQIKTSFHPHQPQPPLPVLPPPPAQLPPPPPPPASEASDESLESQGDDAERVDSETKRRRVKHDDIGSAIIRSTKLLSEKLKHYDDNKERRHNQLIQLEQQRLQLEETRNEVNRQGIATLITSINNLSDAIHSLISEKRT